MVIKGSPRLASTRPATLIFTATYNEAENISSLIQEIFGQVPEADVLVIDDASPDGTGEVLDNMAAVDSRIHVIHRSGKLGLGTAHVMGMRYALENGYQQLVTMDADFSHHPRYLPKLLSLLKDNDFVIGSRYLSGGSLEYGPFRTALSKSANWLVRHLLGIRLHETTTSYRGFQKPLLGKLPLDAIRSNGYSFFVESIFRVCEITNKVMEFPIKFEDRRAGVSKISKKEIYMAVITLSRLALEKATKRQSSFAKLRTRSLR